jgi:hypothetical protein
MMNKILTEWNRFLTEKAPVQAAPAKPNAAAQKSLELQKQKNINLINNAIAPYKGKIVHGADFGLFLEKLATFESTYDPKAVNGSYKGAFQISDDIADSKDPFNPKESAEALYTFFSKKLDGLFKSNPDLEGLVKKSPMLFLFLVHNQGSYGAVRVLYTVHGYQDKLTNKIDTKIGPKDKGKSTVDNINAQKIAALKDKQDELAAKIKDKNVRLATAFVDFLKEKYQL